MFPIWMEEILASLPCSRCRKPLSIDDVTLVGVRRPEGWEAFRAEPIFVICFTCINCGEQVNALHRQSLKESVAGVTAFIKLIEQECQGNEPPIKIPGVTKSAAPLPQAPQPTNGKTARPSVRRSQPTTPPTQVEIRTFMTQLRKASFKSGSKGFSNWLKRFGVDTDAPSDGNTETS